jgi:hypothetical protein
MCCLKTAGRGRKKRIVEMKDGGGVKNLSPAQMVGTFLIVLSHMGG